MQKYFEKKTLHPYNPNTFYYRSPRRQQNWHGRDITERPTKQRNFPNIFGNKKFG